MDNEGSTPAGRARGMLLPAVLAVLVVAWAVMGWLDLSDATQAGFDTDSNHAVLRVLAGSPAETAGLQPGDRIVRIDDIPVGDAAAIARLPRVPAGGVRRYTVEREAGTQSVAVRYGPLAPRTLSRHRVSTVVGLCFLILPLAAFHRRPADATRVLLVMGVGLSFAFIHGPYVAEASLRGLIVAVSQLFVYAGVAAIVHFLLTFPQPRPGLRRHVKRLLYLPALVLWAVLAWRILFTPAGTGLLNALTGLISVVIIGGYLLAAVFLVLRNYSRTDRAQRRKLALNGMLWGTVFGILPALIARLVVAFSPQAALPGQDYYFVTLALIPLMWSRSASRREFSPA